MVWNGKFEDKMKDRAKKPNHKNDVRAEYYSQFKGSDVPHPDNEKTGKKISLPLAYHHITDWALLREIWNQLIDDKHFATICTWLYAVGFDIHNVTYLTGKAQTAAGITGAIMKGEDVADIAEIDEIHERITWSTWNLVEGPEGAIRTDDKGNFHDIFSDVKDGLSPDERGDLKKADAIYTIMSGLKGKKAIPKEQATALSSAFLALNRKAAVIKFRPVMWIHAHGKGGRDWTKNR
jgi:hypothetical protein